MENLPKIETFEYKGAPMSFDLGGPSMLINATQMAKPFGKLPKDYLARNETREMICAILAERGIPLLPESVSFHEGPAADLVRVAHGGAASGTWMHKDLALDFARWLSPEFALWCDRKVQELLQKGVTSIPGRPDWVIPQTYADALMLAATQTKKLEEQAPLVAFAEKVQGSPTAYTVDTTAKELGLPVVAFRKFVQDRCLFRRGRDLLPLAQYVLDGKEWFKVKTSTYERDGIQTVYHTTMVTGLGRIKLKEAWDREHAAQLVGA